MHTRYKYCSIHTCLFFTCLRYSLFDYVHQNVYVHDMRAEKGDGTYQVDNSCITTCLTSTSWSLADSRSNFEGNMSSAKSQANRASHSYETTRKSSSHFSAKSPIKGELAPGQTDTSTHDQRLPPPGPFTYSRTDPSTHDHKLPTPGAFTNSSRIRPSNRARQ